MQTLRVHSISHNSVTNGPGTRSILHVQGCGLGCLGCVNKSTWPTSGGYLLTVDEVVARLTSKSNSEGITISGGEPLDQWVAVKAVVQRVLRKRPAHTVVLFSGYTPEEILEQPAHSPRFENRWEELSATVDTAVLGRFDATKLVPLGQRRNLISSTNQVVQHFSQEVMEISDLPEAEIDIDAQGRLVYRGVAGHSILL